ncbi:MAG: aspartate-semialdehyde dehydrogenase, partial [Alphaproteobacteria bacterium]|nr:aspartate-semialdehyde dehydrogenase [Alphaproteobacteria bacterium]
TIQMVVALKPLHDLATIKRVVVASYQSVSGAGKDAMDELFNQTRGIYMNESPTPDNFTKQIAFNVIPHIDVFMDDGMTKEEWKMVAETKKILDPAIKVSASCARVPVFIGHAEYVNVECAYDIDAAAAKKAFRDAEGVTLIDLDSDLAYVTPAEIAGEDDVFVSRVREDSTVENGLNFWCVADNLRKGAALNAVQIAEILVRDYF